VSLHHILTRSIPLLVLSASAPVLHAQNCTGTIHANVTNVSISSGGLQRLDLSVAPSQIDLGWQVVGAFGTDNPIPVFASAGLRLNNDRYLFRMYTGHAGFVRGGITGFIGGPRVPFDAQGHAQLQVVIPAGLPSSFVGRTLHHGMYRTNPINLLPECGTGTVPLTLVP
jgi:hypothetical protein